MPVPMSFPFPAAPKLLPTPSTREFRRVVGWFFAPMFFQQVLGQEAAVALAADVLCGIVRRVLFVVDLMEMDL